MSESYAFRDLGFENYSQYLKSGLWLTIREKVFQKYGRKCLCCLEHALAVHHRSYDVKTLEGKDLRKLIPLCFTCHDFIHAEGGTLSDVNVRLDKLRMQYNSMRHGLKVDAKKSRLSGPSLQRRERSNSSDPSAFRVSKKSKGVLGMGSLSKQRKKK